MYSTNLIQQIKNIPYALNKLQQKKRLLGRIKQVIFCISEIKYLAQIKKNKQVNSGGPRNYRGPEMERCGLGLSGSSSQLSVDIAILWSQTTAQQTRCIYP